MSWIWHLWVIGLLPMFTGFVIGGLYREGIDSPGMNTRAIALTTAALLWILGWAIAYRLWLVDIRGRAIMQMKWPATGGTGNGPFASELDTRSVRPVTPVVNPQAAAWGFCCRD